MLAQNEPHVSTPQGTPEGTPKIMSRIPSALIPTLSYTGCPAMEPMKPRTSLNQPQSQGRFSRGSPRPVLSSGGQATGNAGRVTNAADISSSPMLLPRTARDAPAGVFFQRYSQVTVPGGRIQPTSPTLSSHVSHHGRMPLQPTRGSAGIARQVAAGAGDRTLTQRTAESPRSCMSI